MMIRISQSDDYYDPVVANSKLHDPYNENIMETIQRKLHLNKNELRVRGYVFFEFENCCHCLFKKTFKDILFV